MSAFITTCARCASEFEAQRSDARFCGTTCRVAAHRERATARVHSLIEQHFAALRRGLAAGDLATVADDLDRIDAEAEALGWPPFPRLTAA